MVTTRMLWWKDKVGRACFSKSLVDTDERTQLHKPDEGACHRAVLLVSWFCSWTWRGWRAATHTGPLKFTTPEQALHHLLYRRWPPAAGLHHKGQNVRWTWSHQLRLFYSWGSWGRDCCHYYPQQHSVTLISHAYSYFLLVAIFGGDMILLLHGKKLSR